MFDKAHGIFMTASRTYFVVVVVQFQIGTSTVFLLPQTDNNLDIE